MIIDNLEFIKNNIKIPQKLMGLDVSKNNLGIALSDISHKIAFPKLTIIRKNLIQDIQKLIAIISQENVFALIIGLPLEKNGDSKERVQSTKTFALNLLKQIEIPIFFQDERFSTYFVENNNINNNKKDVDSQASAWFLQIVLDKLNLRS